MYNINWNKKDGIGKQSNILIVWLPYRYSPLLSFPVSRYIFELETYYITMRLRSCGLGVFSMYVLYRCTAVVGTGTHALWSIFFISFSWHWNTCTITPTYRFNNMTPLGLANFTIIIIIIEQDGKYDGRSYKCIVRSSCVSVPGRGCGPQEFNT